MGNKLILALPVIVVLVFFGITYLSVKSKESQPEQTVVDFIKRLKGKNLTEAASLLTGTPEYFDKVITLKLNKIDGNHSESTSPSKANSDSETNNSIQSLVKKKEGYDNEKLLRIIRESFREELNFEGIVAVIKHDNEAKISATFSRAGYANTNYNFLLIKEGVDWKIFEIYINNNVGLDLYEFWAVDRSKM